MGGEPMVTDNAGDVVASVARRGSGACAFIGIAGDLSDAALGDSAGYVGTRPFDLHQLLYGLIDTVMPEGKRIGNKN